MKKKIYATGKEIKELRREILHKTIEDMAAFLGRTGEYIEKMENEGIIASFDADITKRTLELHLHQDCFTSDQREAVEAFVSKLA